MTASGDVSVTGDVTANLLASQTLRLFANANQIVVGLPNEVKLNIDTSSNRTITIGSTAGLNANVVLTESAQTINGVKTFSSTAVFLAGFSIASLTLSAVSNQLTLGTGNQITLNAPTPAASLTYSLPDVGVNANFVMTQGAQTINGVKTFSNTVVFLAGFSIASLTLSAISNQLTMGTGNQIILNAPTPAASPAARMPRWAVSFSS
jgi:hydrogenase/urease accessory protein HupE